MESRNLATAQEMVRTGNYLIPTMNGELRLEKPPLPTWIAAVVEQVLPDNLVAQRSVAGVFATLMVIFLFLLVRRFTKNPVPALIASIVLATSFNVIMMGRTATWDIYCHSFMLGAIYFFVTGFMRKGSQWMQFSLAGVFMGLSFLSKGPVSFYALLLPFLISYFVALRPSARGKKLPLVLMIVICLIISFWWPAYIAFFHPETGLAIANKESSSWINHNVRPSWYYWKFPAEAGIWAAFWITSLIYYFWKKKPENRKIYFFSIIWTFAALILLSVIPEKKTRYLLPLLIPGAMNISFYFYQSMQGIMARNEKIVFRINGFIIGLVALLIPAVIYFIIPDPGISSLIFILISVLSLVLAVCIFKVLFARHTIRIGSFFALVTLLMMMFESFCLIPVGDMFINDNLHSIHHLREESRVKGLPFYHPQEEPLRMELVYEANRTIRPLELNNDSILQASLPFVIVSTQPVKELFGDKHVSIEIIDTFDNNWRKVTDKRYNQNLVKEVAIIRKPN
ncbi:MAG: glycosyltransferase family 39 protein [Bacteroides sp.]|nr:glycosyltransferase family 39 protein [Bacteroides sp.]